MKKEHTHIWKYTTKNGDKRICESPFEMLVKGCGRPEIKVNDKWVYNHAKEI